MLSALLNKIFPSFHRRCCYDWQFVWKWDTEREREMFYLTTHSTHFIYGYMASDIWLRTILIVRKEIGCRHIGYSFRLTARVLLYAPSHRQDNTYQDTEGHNYKVAFIFFNYCNHELLIIHICSTFHKITNFILLFSEVETNRSIMKCSFQGLKLGTGRIAGVD